jgi:hypothetical protein
MRSPFVVLSCAVFLAACGGVQQVDATNPTVAFAHRYGDSGEADARAREYCRSEFGRQAAVTYRESDRTTYECVGY